MLKYRATKPTFLHCGEVGLTEKQYKRRVAARCLEPIGKDIYKIVKPVCFKAGEIFKYKGEPGKGLGVELIEEKPTQAKKAKP